MKKTRFTEEEMVKLLREADQAPVAEVAKKHGISDVTIYAWRKRLGKLEPLDLTRLRQLEQENAKRNEFRPHSSLGQLTPAEFKQKLLTMSPEPAIS